MKSVPDCRDLVYILLVCAQHARQLGGESSLQDWRSRKASVNYLEFEGSRTQNLELT